MRWIQLLVRLVLLSYLGVHRVSKEYLRREWNRFLRGKHAIDRADQIARQIAEDHGPAAALRYQATARIRVLKAA